MKNRFHIQFYHNGEQVWFYESLYMSFGHRLKMVCLILFGKTVIVKYNGPADRHINGIVYHDV